MIIRSHVLLLYLWSKASLVFINHWNFNYLVVWDRSEIFWFRRCSKILNLKSSTLIWVIIKFWIFIVRLWNYLPWVYSIWHWVCLPFSCYSVPCFKILYILVWRRWASILKPIKTIFITLSANFNIILNIFATDW